jgi:hypothetical protein
MLNKFAMRNVSILIMIIAVIGIGGCKKSSSGTTGTVILKFNPMFGSSSMVLNNQYMTPDNKYFTFQHFKFFMSHIKLVRSDNSAVEVSPMVYVSLDDSSTLSIPITCPVGSYTGISFYLGLDSEQNEMAPNLTDPSSPIFANHYMNWATGLNYTFVFIDGLAGSTSNPSNPMEYHVGTNPYYTYVAPIAKKFSVSGGSQASLVLTANVQNVFYGTTGAINVLTDPVTQTTETPYAGTLAHTFITDFSQIFSLQ